MRLLVSLMKHGTRWKRRASWIQNIRARGSASDWRAAGAVVRRCEKRTSARHVSWLDPFCGKARHHFDIILRGHDMKSTTLLFAEMLIMTLMIAPPVQAGD